jgi:hypothetical protein
MGECGEGGMPRKTKKELGERRRVQGGQESRGWGRRE